MYENTPFEDTSSSDPRRVRPDRTCRVCGDHRAVSRYRGVWAVRSAHDLCPRCWRAETNRLTASLLQEDAVPASLAA